MLQFYLDSPSYKGRDGAAIHDAVTVLYLLFPELFSGKEMHVEIDCSEGLNRGMTVCDMRHSAAGCQGGILVLNDVDLPAFQKKVLDTLAGYDQ